jgi:hypothetical protein
VRTLGVAHESRPLRRLEPFAYPGDLVDRVAGEDTGTPISEDYEVPFEFTGTLERVTIELADHTLSEAELRKYREGQLKAALAE